MKNILLVDDDANVRSAVMTSLESRDYSVIECSDGDEAIKLLENRPRLIDCVVTDFQMQRVHGDKVTEVALNIGKPVVMITGSIQRARNCINHRHITDEQLKHFRILEKGSFRLSELDEEIKKLCV